nr:hypothetical protein [Tanacetum cinerariifolium]
MAKDKAIPRRNKIFWHFARDDSMFTTIRVVSKHPDTHVYGALLPQHLTNQAMLESEAYKTYHAYATDDDNEQTKSYNDGDEFLHPKLSTFDEEARHDEKHDEEEEGVNIKEEKPPDEDMKNEEEEVDELYNETHVIMTAVTPEAQQQSSSVSSGFISNMLNPYPDTSIDSILNLNTESTSLVDVPVSTNLEMPPSSVTTLPPPPILFIQPQQQTLVPPPAFVSSTSLQNLPTFGYLFKFEDRVKDLEDDFSIHVFTRVENLGLDE